MDEVWGGYEQGFGGGELVVMRRYVVYKRVGISWRI